MSIWLGADELKKSSEEGRSSLDNAGGGEELLHTELPRLRHIQRLYLSVVQIYLSI